MMRVVKIILPVIILAIGLGAYQLLASMRKPPQKVERSYLGPLVEAIAVPAQQVQITVEGQGTVRPNAQIDVVPQVSGMVIWKADEFEPGGSFAEGDLLFQIEPRDYQLAVDQAEAQVAQASYQLDLAREEAVIARQEWKRIGIEGAKPTDLVLRKPQLRAAEAAFQGARARFAETQLRLERTKVYAPFSGRVRTARVDVGQHLNVGQAVGEIYSIEKAEIVVPVPDEDLGWFTLPLPVEVSAAGEEKILDFNDEGSDRPYAYAREGASAAVYGSFAGHRHQWTGRVVRTEGELDPQSRMARLVVEVDAPYGGIADGIPPLTVGMFVDVEIAGRSVEDVRMLPRAALRGGDRIWIIDSYGLLRIRDAQVVRAMQERILAHVDMAPEDRIVTSQLNGVTDGMQVRLASAQ